MANNNINRGRRSLLVRALALTAVCASMSFTNLAAQDVTPGPFVQLQASLDQLAGAFSGQTSIEVRDLTTGEVVASSNSADMPAASTIKIPVMVEVFNQIASGSLHLRDTVTLQNADRDYGSGALASKKSGTKYSIQYLLNAMITVSDNTATNMLMRTVGLDSINQTMSSLGLTRTKVADFIHTDTLTGDVRLLRSSAEDMTTLLTMMYKGTLVDLASSEAMLDILSRQRHNGLIPRPLPPGLRIAHKTGTLNDTLNDVGIIFLKQHPYVLAVMTTGVSKYARIAFIQNISRVVYANETASDPSLPKPKPASRSSKKRQLKTKG